ncbi:hypothetical protein Tco_1377010 [Tanacetum coccineum]
MNKGSHTRRLSVYLRSCQIRITRSRVHSRTTLSGPEVATVGPPLLDYVQKPIYTPRICHRRDVVFSAEGAATAGCCAPMLSHQIMFRSPILRQDPEEDDDEDPEEDPVDYPADGGDDGDDEEGWNGYLRKGRKTKPKRQNRTRNGKAGKRQSQSPGPNVEKSTQGSSEDDKDDDMDIKTDDDDDEEEEHPAPADFIVVALPATDQAPFAEETESFETDESASTPPPHHAYRVTARISILAPVPTPVWSDVEVARLLAISTPPSSPLSSYSSPLPHIPSPPLPPIPSPSLPVSPPLPLSPPLPVSSPVPVLSPSPPASSIRPLGYRAAMIRLRAEAASTSYSLPLPPPLHLLSTDHREDRPGVTLPPRKRLGIALGPTYEVGESSFAIADRPAGGLRADYDFVATMDREIRRDPERDVRYGITDSQDTDEIYTRLDDEQSGRQLLVGWLNMLFRDRRAHARTTRLIETEARMFREAWGRSMDASDLVRVEVMLLRTTVLAQQSQIRELQLVDRRRQTVISELLAADYRRQRQLIEALKLVQSYRDSRDLLRVLHSQSYRRRLVVVPRLCYG